MRRFLSMALTVSVSCLHLRLSAQGPVPPQAVSLTAARIAELNLAPETAHQLSSAMSGKDYRRAEAILLGALPAQASGLPRARLLDYLGGVYFSADDYLQAAIAWKKAEAIAPLQPTLRFSLAMAYVRLGHGDWARAELRQLAAAQPANALFPYWLGRIDYDAQQYDTAIEELKKSIALSPSMAKAHDNLGLCYFYLNRNQQAEQEFREAIALETSSTPEAAWPHLNLAILLDFLGQAESAMVEVRKALALEPALAQAHFELAELLEKQGDLQAAAASFHQAAHLDPNYPEPHLGLARVLRRQGDSAGAEREVSVYKKLHAQKAQGGPAQASPP